MEKSVPHTRMKGRPPDVIKSELEDAVAHFQRGATAEEAATRASVSASAVKRFLMFNCS